ncbi:MAG: hypothetical protein JWQ07_5905 [Ramlibacter sp.]|nr:hypothetical protein [Ramlibacter sp.]
MGTLGSWASFEDVASLLTAGSPVVVHGFGRPFRDLAVADAPAFWLRVRDHFQIPGTTSAEPDDEGLTYAAQVWRKEGERLLGFVEFC